MSILDSNKRRNRNNDESNFRAKKTLATQNVLDYAGVYREILP